VQGEIGLPDISWGSAAEIISMETAPGLDIDPATDQLWTSQLVHLKDAVILYILSGG
jgi:hypothetical protein